MFSSFLTAFRRNQWKHHVCVCCVDLGWAPEGTRPRNGVRHGDSRGWFFPTEFSVCKILADFFVHAVVIRSSITDVFHVDNNFQQSTRWTCTAQILNLAFPSASIHTSSRPSRAPCVTYTCHTNIHCVSHPFDIGRRLTRPCGRRFTSIESETINISFLFEVTAAMCKSGRSVY